MVTLNRSKNSTTQELAMVCDYNSFAVSLSLPGDPDSSQWRLFRQFTSAYVGGKEHIKLAVLSDCYDNWKKENEFDDEDIGSNDNDNNINNNDNNNVNNDNNNNNNNNNNSNNNNNNDNNINNNDNNNDSSASSQIICYKRKRLKI